MLKETMSFLIFSIVSFRICLASGDLPMAGLKLNCCTISQPPIVQVDVSQPVRTNMFIWKNGFFGQIYLQHTSYIARIWGNRY